MCKVYKHFSFFKFRNGRCRLCIYLNRYRFGHTSNQFREHVYKYNIGEAVSRICEADSLIGKAASQIFVTGSP